MGKFRFGQTTAIFCLVLTLAFPQFLLAAEGADNDVLWTMFLNWLPMLVLIGVWIYFIKYSKTMRTWSYSEETD